MLLVKVKTKESLIHGTGLFAGEDLPAGTKIWKPSEVIDQSFTINEFVMLLKKMSPGEQEYMLSYCYKRHNIFWYVSDLVRFINHDPQHYNCSLDISGAEVAQRKILAGEELLENYSLLYDDDDFFNLSRCGDPGCYIKYIEEHYVELHSAMAVH